jgi:hypothetical protein
MEATEILMGLLGMAVAVIVGLAALLRRNGANNKGGNPNLETMGVQLEQIIALQRDANQQLGDMAVTLGKLDTKIGFCPTVQRGAGGS